MAPAKTAYSRWTRAASRSATTIARAAKAKKKARDHDAEWSERDRDDAAAQGWGVYECIDEKTLKVFFEVQAEGERFAHDALARNFVMQMNKAGDELAIKALRIVFSSKVNIPTRRKK